MQDFRDLSVWQRAHELALLIYKCTAQFPAVEVYGLTSQMRRAAVSIPSNLAEGCVRGTDPDFARYCSIALGSASELDYQVLLAKDLGFVSQTAFSELAQRIEEVKKMVNGLLQRLKKSS